MGKPVAERHARAAERLLDAHDEHQGVVRQRNGRSRPLREAGADQRGRGKSTVDGHWDAQSPVGCGDHLTGPIVQLNSLAGRGIGP